jgi:hypothetical protein
MVATAGVSASSALIDVDGKGASFPVRSMLSAQYVDRTYSRYLHSQRLQTLCV